jgi:predicted dinucleotide-binding enzyme
MGSGLALRLSLKHEVTIGSRSAEKAVEVAAELTAKARGFYMDAMRGSIEGALNEDAVEGREIILEALPASAAVSSLSTLKEALKPDQIIVSCVVPMKKKGKLFVWSPVVWPGMRRVGRRAHQEAARPPRSFRHSRQSPLNT